jgi:hypothetical protein
MTGITTYLSILTLNIKGLNSPSKDTDWQTGLKRKTQHLLPMETHLIDRNKHWLRMKGWKMIANGPHKKAGVTIFISDKVDFKLTLIK